MSFKTSSEQAMWPAITIEGNLIAPSIISEISNPPDDDKSYKEYEVRKGLTLREEISTSFRVGKAHYNSLVSKEQFSVESTRQYMSEFLRETFSFNDLKQSDGIVSYIAGGRVPIIVVPPSDNNLDKVSKNLSGIKNYSPSLALQKFLNENENTLWGLVTNGSKIRLIRNDSSLTRPSFIEADFEQIFENDDFASFSVLWPLIHRSRFGVERDPPTECFLEKWREKGIKEGVAARDRLAGQVQEVLKILGSGFLEDNPRLTNEIKSGEISLTELLNELLQLVYRLIFLMVAEDRNLLHLRDSSSAAMELYSEGYSLSVLRKNCIRSTTWNKYFDRYEGMKIVFQGLREGQDKLALPELGGLFSEEMQLNLEKNDIRLRNSVFMKAIYYLSWLDGKKGIIPINWRMMDTEELGSVYETLLELQPQFGENGKLIFASDLAEVKGNQRKSTGSFYTPSILVNTLLDSTLDPVLEQTINKSTDPEKAILEFSVIDPACGSGHFLLASARRIAEKLASIRADGTPNIEDYRHALRDVARNCIFGVDRNPLAIEITKVGLWIETLDPGLPLGFFDEQIRCGNSIVGIFDLDSLKNRIPSGAFKDIFGDDKNDCIALREKNRHMSANQGVFDISTGSTRFFSIEDLGLKFQKLRELSENNVNEISGKKSRFSALRNNPEFIRIRNAADLWTAAFLNQKNKDSSFYSNQGKVPVSDDIWKTLLGDPVSTELQNSINFVRNERPFHWPLEFPDKIQNGFNVVIGNPPWERIKLQEKKFFASRETEVANAKNKGERTKIIEDLEYSRPELHNEWNRSRREALATSHFIRESGRFPLGSVGDVNLYPVFCDLSWQLTHRKGRTGLIIQSSMLTGYFYKEFIKKLLSENSLISFYGFLSNSTLFPDIHVDTKFGLLTIGGNDTKVDKPWFSAHLSHPTELVKQENIYPLSWEEIKSINPNTYAIPMYRNSKDSKISSTIYMNSTVLIEKDGKKVIKNNWDVQLKRYFDMTNDTGKFINNEEIAYKINRQEGIIAVLDSEDRYYPLYEGKMISHYDHRYGTYENQSKSQANQGVLPHVNDNQHNHSDYRIEPRYWVKSDDVIAEIGKNLYQKWFYSWRVLGISERTFIGTIIPETAVGNSASVLICNQETKMTACLIAMLSSLVVDYAARQRAERMVFHVVEQLPVLPPKQIQCNQNWLEKNTVNWISDRVLELSYTNIDLKPFAEDLGRNHMPFKWIPDRRTILQAELNAIFFHLYGLNIEQTEWIIDSFEVLNRVESRNFGEFKTKNLVMSIYEKMLKAKSQESVYCTPLDMQPADTRLCHDTL